MELTHGDWLAVPHRDPSDPTPLRSLKPRPGRSLYLYHEPNRDTATIRARLRLNRAGTQINADRGTVAAGLGLCLTCSQQRQQATPDSVQHMVLECMRYHSARQRLNAQLSRLTASTDQSIRLPGRPPPLPLTLDLILGQPSPIRAATAAQQASRWATWFSCTGAFLRSITLTRTRMGLSAL